MPRIQTLVIECDECKKQFEILDNKETPGAEEILHTKDAMGKEVFHCGIACHLKWASKYKCPYRGSYPTAGSIDELLPGLN